MSSGVEALEQIITFAPYKKKGGVAMRKYFLFAVLATGVWGLSGPTAQKLELAGNGILFAVLKASSGMLILSVPILCIQSNLWNKIKKDFKTHWKLIAASSVGCNIGMALLFQSFAVMNNPTLTMVIFSTSPLISSCVAQAVKRRFQWKLIAATCLCFLGIILVIISSKESRLPANGNTTAGIILALIGAIAISVWLLVTQYFGEASISNFRLVLYQLVIGTALIGGFALVFGYMDLDKCIKILVTPNKIGILATNSITSNIAVVIFLYCIRKGGTAYIAPAQFADTLTTPLFAYLVVGTPLLPLIIIGVLITVSGGYIAMNVGYELSPQNQPASATGQSLAAAAPTQAKVDSLGHH